MHLSYKSISVGSVVIRTPDSLLYAICNQWDLQCVTMCIVIKMSLVYSPVLQSKAQGRVLSVTPQFNKSAEPFNIIYYIIHNQVIVSTVSQRQLLSVT